jgi:hypothetical protein
MSARSWQLGRQRVVRPGGSAVLREGARRSPPRSARNRTRLLSQLPAQGVSALHPLPVLLLSVLTGACLAAPATELVTTFATAPSTDDWDLHGQGGGRATVEGGSLRLDMTAPVQGKHVWADLRKTLRAPLTVEWDQQIAADSPHLYLAGVCVGDGQGHSLIAALSGQPAGHTARLADQASIPQFAAGTWYHLVLEVSASGAASLKITGPDAAEPFSMSVASTALRGRHFTLSLYHNQPRTDPPDQYAQDRGSSRFRNVRVSAAAILPGDLSSFRDAELRGPDMRAPMVFNRATTWLGEDDGVRGAVLAYDRGGDLLLTGHGQAASWQPNRLCTMQPLDATSSLFTRPNDLDGYDRAAIRAFQWCIRQRPVLQYDLRPRAGRCYLKVCIMCPYLGDGIELFRTPESAQSQTGAVDLAPLFERRGLGYHQFQEISLYVYQDRPSDPAAPAGSAEVSLKLTGSGALLTTPPIVRTAESARAGIDIHALVAGPAGLRHSQTDGVIVQAEVDKTRVPLTEVGESGVFRATLTGLPVGEHEVLLTSRDAAGATMHATLSVMVVPSDFASWKPDHPTYQLPDGRVLPTLLGDLYAWVPILDAASESRRVILSADQWRGLSAEEQGRVSLVKLRTLSEAEISAQLKTHYANGIRVIRLAPNISPVEAYLDVGGHVAMQGLETLSVVLRECRRLGIRALINLFHYPYGSPGTGNYPPWDRYMAAGYAGPPSFTTPQIEPLLKAYLAQLLVFLRDDPAVLGYTLTGENDQSYGAAWINDMAAHVKACDPNHMLTLEQGGGVQSCAGGNPWSYDAFMPRKSGGVGYRTYYTGGMRSDAYFMVCGRFYRCNPPAFLAEVASGPGWYGHFARTWTHPDFISKVRDNCWASVLTSETMCITWSAPWTQEERLIPQLCCEQLDWARFSRKRPPVAVRVTNVDGAMIRRLVEYETALARLGVDYDYVWDGRDDAAAYQVILDARTEFALPQLPPEVLAARPVVASGEYSVSYLQSEAPTQLVAFIRNTAEYKLGPGYGTGVQELHRQRTKPTDLTITLGDLPDGAACRIYDVDERRLVREGTCKELRRVDLGTTAHDFALVVR